MEPWKHEPDAEHLAAYRRIVEQLRLLADDNRTTLQRLRSDLEIVLQNEEATRRLLAEKVYGIPEEWLDELLRIRLSELDQ